MSLNKTMTDLMNDPRGDWVAAPNFRTSKKGNGQKIKMI
jgi:hypothetical protein